MKPKVLDVDCQTGEQTVREMTDAEYDQYLLDKANGQASADSQE